MRLTYYVRKHDVKMKVLLFQLFQTFYCQLTLLSLFCIFSYNYDRMYFKAHVITIKNNKRLLYQLMHKKGHELNILLSDRFLFLLIQLTLLYFLLEKLIVYNNKVDNGNNKEMYKNSKMRKLIIIMYMFIT